MPSLADTLGLGLRPGRGAPVRPSAFMPVGTVASTIKGGSAGGFPGAPAPATTRPQSAAGQQLDTEKLIAGDDPDAEKGLLGMDPLMKDSIILGVAAGLESGTAEGLLAGALRGWGTGKTIQRGRPARAEAAAEAKRVKTFEEGITMRETDVAESEADSTRITANTGAVNANTRIGELNETARSNLAGEVHDAARLDLDKAVKFMTDQHFEQTYGLSKLQYSLDKEKLALNQDEFDRKNEADNLLLRRAETAAEQNGYDIATPAGQAYIQAVLDAEATKTPSTAVTVSSAQKERAKLNAKFDHERATEERVSYTDALHMRPIIAQLKATNAEAATGSAFAPRKFLREFAGLFKDENGNPVVTLDEGFFGETISATLWEQARNQIALTLAPNMKGNLNATEFNTLLDGLVSAGGSTAGNQIAIEVLERYNVRTSQLEDLFNQHMRAVGMNNLSAVDANDQLISGQQSWYEKKKDFIDSTPIWDDEFIARIGAAKQLEETPEFVISSGTSPKEETNIIGVEDADFLNLPKSERDRLIREMENK